MIELDRVQIQWHPTTEDERKSVLEQLERGLASPLFRNSKRYPALLRFVVEQSLNGNEHLLKERLLGVDVFHRRPDYDTNEDTIVRLTAGEVRKRIVQYYQQPEHRNELRIILNSGSYIPHFSQATDHHQTTLVQTRASLPPAEGGSAHPFAQPQIDSASEISASGNAAPNRRLWFWLGVTVLALVIAGLLVNSVTTSRHDSRGVLWRAVLKNPDPVIFVLPDLSQTELEKFQQDDRINLLDHLRRGRIVDFGDTVAMSRLATYLTREKKEFEVQLSSEVSYTKLQQGPAIFIGGIDNAWTMRVLQPLRFHIERRGSTLTYDILDRQQPDGRLWSLDLAKPFSGVTVDYAIVASVFDKTTGRPILVVAGLGANGTTAAAKFILDKGSNLQHVIPVGWKGANMEFIIETQVIDDKAGPPQLVAWTFW